MVFIHTSNCNASVFMVANNYNFDDQISSSDFHSPSNHIFINGMVRKRRVKHQGLEQDPALAVTAGGHPQRPAEVCWKLRPKTWTTRNPRNPQGWKAAMAGTSADIKGEDLGQWWWTDGDEWWFMLIYHDLPNMDFEWNGILTNREWSWGVTYHNHGTTTREVVESIGPSSAMWDDPMNCMWTYVVNCHLQTLYFIYTWYYMILDYTTWYFGTPLGNCFVVKELEICDTPCDFIAVIGRLLGRCCHLTCVSSPGLSLSKRK